MRASSQDRRPVCHTVIGWNEFNSENQDYDFRIRKKGKLTELRRKETTTVDVKRTIVGQDGNDMRDLNVEVRGQVKDQNRKIEDAIRAKISKKMELINQQVSQSKNSYFKRREYLNDEQKRMQTRFDYLKGRELKLNHMIDSVMTKTNNNSLLRKAFNGFRDTIRARLYNLTKS